MYIARITACNTTEGNGACSINYTKKSTAPRLVDLNQEMCCRKNTTKATVEFCKEEAYTLCDNRSGIRRQAIVTLSQRRSRMLTCT